MLTSLILSSVMALDGQRAGRSPLSVGDNAPKFELKLLGKDEKFKLESNIGNRPTVLIFGSYT